LGILGIHRIRTKSRNPEAHGKIEVSRPLDFETDIPPEMRFLME
jgi:hypothetical protein